MAKSVQFNVQKFQEAFIESIVVVMKKTILPLFKRLVQDEH